jgi:APA family basic amino acid/polyamine antiporter
MKKGDANMAMNEAPQDSGGELKRQLGLSAAVAVIIAEVIGVGIFLTPAGMAHDLVAPAWILVAWLVMGLMALCGALCYGELAARFPSAGGNYVFLREAFGLRAAFLYGWMALLVMDPGVTAALAVGFATYLGYLAPMSPVVAKGAAMGVIVALAVLNMSGVRQSANAVRALTVLKVGFLALFLLMAIGSGAGNVGNFVPFSERPPESIPLFGALAGGLVGAFFAFGGWWDLSKLSGEVRDPGRTMPRALVFGVAAVTIIYVLTSAAFVYLVPPNEVASDEAFVARTGEMLFGPAGGRVFATIVIVSVLSALSGLLLAAPRVYYAMARDGVFLESVGRLHPRFGTPVRAIGVQAAMACVLVALGTFDQILSFFIFVVVIFLGLTVLALVALRRRGGPAPAYSTPGYPLTPAVYLVLVAVMLLLLGGNAPGVALAGVLVVALGLPVYALAARRLPG